MADVEKTIRTNNFITAYVIYGNISQAEILKLVGNYDTISFVDRLFESGYNESQAYLLFDMYYNHETIEFSIFNKEFSLTAFMLIRSCLEKGISSGNINRCGGSVSELINLYTNW